MKMTLNSFNWDSNKKGNPALQRLSYKTIKKLPCVLIVLLSKGVRNVTFKIKIYLAFTYQYQTSNLKLK